MASASSRGPLRQLRELLQEQQDPFLLDVYLLEKRYSRTSSDSEADRNNCLKLKRLSSNRLRNRKEKALRKCSAVLRSVLSKFGDGIGGRRPESDGKYPVDGRFTNSSCASGIRREIGFQDEDRIPSASSKSLFLSCSEGDMEECLISTTAFIRISAGHRIRCLKLHSSKAQARNQWRNMRHCKQRSPVSVLEVPSDEEPSSTHKTDDSSPTAGEEREGSLLSATQLEYLVQKIADKIGLQVSEDQELPGFSSSSQMMTTKKMLQQTKKLLQDYIREAQQSYMNKTRWNSHANTAAEMLEKFICDHIRSWTNVAPNSKQLARTDSFNSSAEWFQPESYIKEIGIKIADAIFEQTIDEAVTDMYTSPSQLAA